MVRPRFAMLATAVSALLSLPGVAAATDTVGLVDTTSGRWHLRTADAATASFFYGSPGDVPFAGDWDCDGVDTPGLYRPSDGFVYLRNSNTQGVADLEYYFGDPGDAPLAGDFDGDGCDTVSLYRPSEQRFYVIDRLGSGTTGLGAADFSFLFGNPGDRPFVADVDGDGIDEVALHRPSTGLVYYRTTLTTGVADASFIFGDPGDAILGGDWTGDGVDTVGIFRRDGSGFYLRHSNTAGFADAREVFGDPSWEPVSGDFGPLEGVPDLALRTVVSGLDRPVFLDAPAGDPRLFVVEQGGTIRVVSGDAVLPTPFLTVPVSTGGERGLLGLAFHPGYAANGRLFVMYTDPGGDSVVAEYHAAPAPTWPTPPRCAPCSPSTNPPRTTTAACWRSGPTATSTSAWVTAAAPTTPSATPRTRGHYWGRSCASTSTVRPRTPSPPTTPSSGGQAATRSGCGVCATRGASPSMPPPATC
jgi:hypothetical protein